MRHIVSCDGPVQFKQLVVAQIRQLVGFVRKICFHHYIRTAICKQIHHIVAKTPDFTSVTFKIVVFVGCKRKLIWDVRKNNIHTPLIFRTFQSWARVSSRPPGHCKYLCFSRDTVVKSRSRSKFGNSHLYIYIYIYKIVDYIRWKLDFMYYVTVIIVNFFVWLNLVFTVPSRDLLFCS
jgi:hypothetical protein